ncbi:MAG TPA: hypothetical protein VM884_06860 [Flavisolibacter sp.]|jgi:hypothetical protein|nr:hypothetical protein [Flavisolibacter sp.]
MKSLKIFFFFALITNVFLACKKDKPDVVLSKAEVAGIYEGKFGTGANNPSSFYSFNLKEDGTMVELGNTGAVKGTGTWTLKGNTVTATHKYTFPANAFFISTGTYEAGERKITGTWGYGSSDNDGGKWYMTKK